MKKGIIFLSGALIVLLASYSGALDNPHNINNSVNCGSCHTTSLPGSTLPGWWTSQGEESGVCGQCHNATAAAGADVKGHSSANTSTQYGMWDTKCTNCHNPHTQRQNWKYKSLSYLYTGASTGVTTSTLTTTVAGATNWTADQWKGMILIPNVAYQAFNYRILSNTAAVVGAAGTLTISTIGGDEITLKYIKPGQTFGIVYGKLVKDVVNVKWVRFFRQTGANSFADGVGTIDGICEVCHTQTRMANTTNVVPRWRMTGNSDDHYAGEKCGGCHAHTVGFKATCGSCHGNPPVNTSTLVGFTNPSTTQSGTAGAHNTHVTVKGIDCGGCHYNSEGSGTMHNTVPNVNVVTMGFYNLGGNSQGGTYDGQAAVNYNITTTSPVTSVSSPGTGAKTCSNIYCHSTGQSLTDGNSATPTYATPVWDGTAACGTCHGASKAEVSNADSGSHAKHINNAGVTGCNACHTNANAAGTQYNATTHVDNLIDVAAGVSYTLAGARGNGYGTCNATNCHGTSSPTWGNNTGTTTCEKCHGSATTATSGLFKITAQTTVTAASVIHVSHLASSHNYSSDITCAQCHTVPGAANSIGHIDTALPAEVPMDGALARTGGLTPSYASQTCSTMYCHGYSLASNTGTPPNPPIVVAPAWTATFLGVSSTVGNGNNTPGSGDCAKCHAYPPMNGAAGTHTSKIATDCTTCHTHVNVQGTGFADVTKHINGTVEGGTCNSCHGYEEASWSGATERAPEGKGAHAKHVKHLVALWGSPLSATTDLFGSGASWTNVCGVCHDGATHTTNESIPGNGRQIAIGVSHQFGGSAPVYNGTPNVSSATDPKTCSNIDCHFKETPAWSAY